MQKKSASGSRMLPFVIFEKKVPFFPKIVFKVFLGKTTPKKTKKFFFLKKNLLKKKKKKKKKKKRMASVLLVCSNSL